MTTNYRIYLLWADEKLECGIADWVKDCGKSTGSSHLHLDDQCWRYGHFLTSPRVMSARMNRLIHCPVQEWWLDEVNLGSTVVPYFGAAYVRAVSGGRVAPANRT